VTPDINPKIRVFPQVLREKIKNVSEFLLDIPYSDQSSSQIMDLYLPENANPPYPLVIYIHSGGFINGSKSDTHILPMLRSLEKGYALASVDFRNNLVAKWPAQIYDIKAAVRFLKANSGIYRLDPEKFAMWGASSGAYLAAMIGTTEGNPAFEDPDMGNAGISSSVQAIVDWAGCCDRFDRLDDQLRANGCTRTVHSAYNSPESVLMGNALGEIPELVRMASPCTYVHKGIPNFLIQHGEDDNVIPIQQSVEFAKAIAASAGEDKVRFISYKGVGHDLESEEMMSAVYDFLDAFIGKHSTQ
jgi:acetyl esterase/lipase